MSRLNITLLVGALLGTITTCAMATPAPSLDGQQFADKGAVKKPVNMGAGLKAVDGANHKKDSKTKKSAVEKPKNMGAGLRAVDKKKTSKTEKGALQKPTDKGAGIKAVKRKKKRRPSPCKIAARLCKKSSKKIQTKCRRKIRQARKLFAKANQSCSKVYRKLGGKLSKSGKKAPFAKFIKDKSMLKRNAPICAKATRLAMKKNNKKAMQALSKAHRMHREGRSICRGVVRRILATRKKNQEKNNLAEIFKKRGARGKPGTAAKNAAQAAQEIASKSDDDAEDDGETEEPTIEEQFESDSEASTGEEG